MSKAEALREAQLVMIRDDGRSDMPARRRVSGIGKLSESAPLGALSQATASTSISTAHRYFWAPFILVGDGKCEDVGFISELLAESH